MLLDAPGEQVFVSETLKADSAFGQATSYYGSAFVSAYAETTRPVCLTPCYVDLEPGLHVLKFSSRVDPTRTSTAMVQVSGEGKVVRHALGRVESRGVEHLGVDLMLVSGLSALLTGALLLAAPVRDADDKRDLSKTGRLLVGAGAGVTAISIPLEFLLQPVFQPGSTTEFPLR